MWVIAGGRARSGFEQDAVADRLAASMSVRPVLATRAVYLLEPVTDPAAGIPAAEDVGPAEALTERLDESRMAALCALLDESEAFVAAPGTPVARLWVVPRFGTISPWSSKASEILAHAGFGDAVARVERAVQWELSWPDGASGALDAAGLVAFAHAIHDRMTETVVARLELAAALFRHESPRPLAHVRLGDAAQAALEQANRELGLALSEPEIAYLAAAYAELGRDPTDTELMMFAQANSEHCRHKIFNAAWTLDGEPCEETLFGMIRATHAAHPDGVLSAYRDNASVIEGHEGERFMPSGDGVYRAERQPLAILMKVETHNHPTAISPFPGAATGAGGEIRDEGATGRGSKPKAALTGFSVSNLRIPGFTHVWEEDHGKPGRIVAARAIMLEGPLGASAFNNEFGRPALGGYFRTFEASIAGQRFGYHKPIMMAGGVGSIRAAHVEKKVIPPNSAIIVLGGPAMLIGLGGGAASSMASGESAEALDFASVQRGNPEVERRCQEVIDRCTALGAENPIISIHDIGAGGLSNGVPELLDDAGRGGRINLRRVPSAEPGLSPMEIWCNEAQERYVLAVAADRYEDFAALCERERAPFAAIGIATEERRLVVEDPLLGTPCVDLPMDVLLGRVPLMQRSDVRAPRCVEAPVIDLPLDALVDRVLAAPTVASKEFLISIGDRTVTGLVARDPMVGPFQVPVADCAITTTDLTGHTGEAMAMGERSPVAVFDAPASGRLAVAEVVTNLAGADIEHLSDIKLSANWMAAAGAPGEDANLFDTVQAVSLFCQALGLCIPVGKDSLSMRTRWAAEDGEREQIAPVSLVVTGFARVADVRRQLTPLLDPDGGALFALSLDARNDAALAGSVVQQVSGAFGGTAPDVPDVQALQRFWSLVRDARRDGILCAYHDRSDGGLLVALLEMAFTRRCGLDVSLPAGCDAVATLFHEGPGAVVQVAAGCETEWAQRARAAGFSDAAEPIARQAGDGTFRVAQEGRTLYTAGVHDLLERWAATSYRMARLRDDPACADEAFAALRDANARLDAVVPFELDANPAATLVAPMVGGGARPRVAILREQGVNGQIEMAHAFHRAGFDAVDVTMTDLLDGRVDLAGVQGLAACGGFSYGDVLGAGGGWAKTILYHAQLRAQFAAFFGRPETFSLGVCNGCQMLSQLAELIPGSAHWPRFRANRSGRFEARLSLVEVAETDAPWLAGMAGLRAPIAVSHGEGRAVWAENPQPESAVLRYVDAAGATATRYPHNPNGSACGATGFTSADGRVLILMPHPERVTRAVQMSWHPLGWGERSPWARLFDNARVMAG